MQKGLIGGAASLGHKQEMIFLPIRMQNINLSRKIRTGVFFLKHCQGRKLGKTQVVRSIGLFNTPG